MTEKSDSKAFLYVPSVFPVGVVLAGAEDPVDAAMDRILGMPTLPHGAKEFIRSDPEGSFDLLMQRFQLMLVLKNQGEISIFSARNRNKFPVKVTNRLRDEFGIWPETPVGWFSSLNAGPETLTAAQVMFGKNPPRQKAASVAPPVGQRRTLKRKKFWGPSESIVDKLLK